MSTHTALPAIRPVIHLVDRDYTMIKINLGSGTGTAARVARLVTEPADIRRYEHLLHTWVDGLRDCVIRIPPDLLTGYELAPVAVR